MAEFAEGRQSHTGNGNVKHKKSWDALGDFTTTEGERVLDRALSELARMDAVLAFPDEALRVVVYRMAEKGFTRMPVVDRDTGKFLGLVLLDDLLKARSRHLEEERRRERTLKLRFLLPGRKVVAESQVRTAP